MKVAFIVGEFPLLSESFILNQIAGLIDRGHEVHIYAIKGPPKDCPKVHPIVQDYDLIAKTTYGTPVPPRNFLPRLGNALKLLFQSGQVGSLRWLRLVNVFKFGREAASLRLLYQGLPFLDCPTYDIIHAQFGGWGTFALRLRDLDLLKGSLITHFRGRDISVHLRQKGPHIYNDLLQRGEFFLTNCDFFCQRILGLGCSENKILIHGSAIDCDKFRFTPRTMPADGAIRVATVGRLSEKKGIEYCIRAAASLIHKYPNIELKIIGEGPLRGHFEQLIQELNATNFIKLLGWKTQAEIIEILDNCHLFLAPSVTAQDGDQDAPVNTLKEAMAMGLPVISTWHGGIPELVENGVSGYLVPERDADAIADKLSTLINNADRWGAMGKAGRQKVKTLYDLNTLNDELVTIYQSILATHQPKTIQASHRPITDISEAVSLS
ncbi:MAG: glycosyltransferase [Cyanobacteria bacterium J06627_3]